MLSSSIILFLLPLGLAAVNGPCSASGTPGVCISTASCSSGGGSSQSGFCPNDPGDIKCCTKTQCGSAGNCRFSSACSGTSKAGLCPGPADFKCCEPGSSGTTPGGSSGGANTADRKLSANGFAFIKRFESFKPNFYFDIAASSHNPVNVVRNTLSSCTGCQNHRIRSCLSRQRMRWHHGTYIGSPR